MIEHPKSIQTPRSSEMANQYLITAKQFFEEGYLDRVTAGEIEVFDVAQPPIADTSEDEKAEWLKMLETNGNGTSIKRAEKLDDDYYLLQGLGMKGDHQLVVFPKAK